MGVQGAHLNPPDGPLLEPPGPLLTHLHTVHMAYSECLPTRLNPLAERSCLSQVQGPRGAARSRPQDLDRAVRRGEEGGGEGAARCRGVDSKTCCPHGIRILKLDLSLWNFAAALRRTGRQACASARARRGCLSPKDVNRLCAIGGAPAARVHLLSCRACTQALIDTSRSLGGLFAVVPLDTKSLISGARAGGWMACG